MAHLLRGGELSKGGARGRLGPIGKVTRGAGGQQCQQIWDMMEQHDEQQLNELVQHMRQHLDRDLKGAAAA
jgi:hypothetical protein